MLSLASSFLVAASDSTGVYTTTSDLITSTGGMDTTCPGLDSFSSQVNIDTISPSTSTSSVRSSSIPESSSAIQTGPVNQYIILAARAPSTSSIRAVTITIWILGGSALVIGLAMMGFYRFRIRRSLSLHYQEEEGDIESPTTPINKTLESTSVSTPTTRRYTITPTPLHTQEGRGGVGSRPLNAHKTVKDRKHRIKLDKPKKAHSPHRRRHTYESFLHLGGFRNSLRPPSARLPSYAESLELFPPPPLPIHNKSTHDQ